MGRYIKGPPIKFRSIRDIYGHYNYRPEYRSGKNTDGYGKFQEKYEPKVERKIERSPEAKPAQYNNVPEQHHLKSEGTKDPKDKPITHEFLQELYDKGPEKQISSKGGNEMAYAARRDENPENKSSIFNKDTLGKEWVYCSNECGENTADGRADPNCQVCFGDGYEILKKREVRDRDGTIQDGAMY